MFDSAYFEKLLGESQQKAGRATMTIALQSGMELNVSRIERVDAGYVTLYVHPPGRKQPLESGDAKQPNQEADLLSISYDAIAYVQVSERPRTERAEVGFKMSPVRVESEDE